MCCSHFALWLLQPARRCKGRPNSEYILRAQAAEESPFQCCTNPYCSRNAIVQDLGTIEIQKVRELLQR